MAAVALPAAGAYGAYAGTKAAVGATADAAKASRGALGHVAHWAWSGLEWVGDVAGEGTACINAPLGCGTVTPHT